MINYKKITIIISFFLLLSCGYEPIFSSSKGNFSITEIELLGKKLDSFESIVGIGSESNVIFFGTILYKKLIMIKFLKSQLRYSLKLDSFYLLFFFQKNLK